MSKEVSPVTVEDRIAGVTALLPHWNSTIPHDPFPKQLAFLMTPQKGPILFGGSAGPGKSDALLMGALQFADIPGYSGIIFRRTFSDLNLPGALIDRSRDWLMDVPGCRWDDQKHSWIFNCSMIGGPPGRSRLAFGYLEKRMDRYRYRSAEFQYMAFDELTEFYEEDFRFVCHRLRRPKCELHDIPGRVFLEDGTCFIIKLREEVPFLHSLSENKRASKLLQYKHLLGKPLPDELLDRLSVRYNPACKICVEYIHLSKVPLRIRCASNPGGPGHRWVKDFFDIKAKQIREPLRNKRGDLIKDKEGNSIQQTKTIYVGGNERRPYLPAFLEDNPALDQDEYTDTLSDLDPITREQLMKGDWGISPQGRFKPAWFRNTRYTRRGSHVVLGRDGAGEGIDLSRIRLFMIVDPAASAREGPGDEEIWKNREASWSVVSVWAVAPPARLLLWDLFRFQKEIPDVIKGVEYMYYKHSYQLCFSQKKNGTPRATGIKTGQRKPNGQIEVLNLSGRKEWLPDLSYTDHQPSLLRPEFIGIENAGPGMGVFQSVQRIGLPVKALSPMSGDKLVRSTDASNMAEQGRVWLPQQAGWLDKYEAELFTWTAHPHQQDDQIDVTAYAATEALNMINFSFTDNPPMPTRRNLKRRFV